MFPLPQSGWDAWDAKLQHAWENKAASYPMRRDALMLGLASCGLRSIEILNLRVVDIFGPNDGTIYVRTAKKGAPRRVPVGDSWMLAAKQLMVHMAVVPARPAMPKKQKFYGVYIKTAPYFLTARGNVVEYTQVRRRCREWTEQIYGQAYTAHCCRHMAAVRYYLKTESVFEVSRLLGHKSLQWTTTYLKGVMSNFDLEGMPSFVTSLIGKEEEPAPPAEPLQGFDWRTARFKDN